MKKRRKNSYAYQTGKKPFHLYEMVQRPENRRWFRDKQLFKQRLNTVAKSRIHRRTIAKVSRKNLFQRVAYVGSRIFDRPTRLLDRDCRSEWRKLLSWRKSQKGKGGNRKRKERSPREKAASRQKHLKDC